MRNARPTALQANTVLTTGPQLVIAPLVNAARLCWTTNAPGFALQTNRTIANTNEWGTLTTNLSVVEIMEVWATDKLLPFQPCLKNQPPRFDPRAIDEEQWGDLLKGRKLLPLLASSRFENGAERLRFEVSPITPAKIEDTAGDLFQPPPDYQETEPLPF